MEKNTYNLLEEPTARKYRELLDYTLGECHFFLLVTSLKESSLSESERRVLDQLAPYLYAMNIKNEWPGTILLTGAAVVYVYYYTTESASILKASANSLYQWQEPDLPDDLCLLRSDESPWLVNTAHESDSYFVLNEDELIRLLNALPDYHSMIEVGEEK